MHNSKYKGKKKKIPGQDRDWICQCMVIMEYSMRRPLEMTIFGNRGKEKNDVTIYKKVLTADGTVMEGEDAIQYVAEHRRDIERLMVESSKLHGEEKEVIARLHVAKLADKAGQAGRYAVVPMMGSEGIRRLKVGREHDEPVFILDNSSIKKEDAEDFIREHYMEFLLGMQKAEAGLYGYHVETVMEQQPGGKKDKPVFDLDKLLPSKPKPKGAGKKDLQTLGNKYFSKSAKSHLRERR